jgi:hypothetical protein
MKVEPAGEPRPLVSPTEPDLRRVEALLERAGDPAACLEALAAREHSMFRRTAHNLQRVQLAARRRALEQAIGEMESAARWRMWAGISQAACQLVQTCIGAAGGGDQGGSSGGSASQGGSSAGGGGGTSTASGVVGVAGTVVNTVLEQYAGKDDREATWARAESDQRLGEARAAEDWLRNIRASETKMLERLEAYLRAEHEGRMACFRG